MFFFSRIVDRSFGLPILDYLVDDLVDALDPLLAGYPTVHAQHRLKRQVLRDGEGADEQIVLLHVSHHRGEHGRRYPTAVRGHQTERGNAARRTVRQGVQQGRLAGARRAHDHQQLAGISHPAH